MSAEITRINTAAEARLIDQFKAAQASIPGIGRDAAFASFAKNGLPHRRIEAWHYTDLRAVMREAHPPAQVPTADTLAQAKTYLETLPAAHGARFVIVDGSFAKALSAGLEQPGLTIRSLIDVLGEGSSEAVDQLATPAIEQSESVLALNAAFMQGGAVISLAPGATVEHPIELVFLTTAAAASAVTTRSIVVAGDHSSGIVTERHERLGTAPAQANHAMIMHVGDGASLDHIVMAGPTDKTVQSVSTVVARLGAEADLKSFALVTGSGFTRRQAFVNFDGAHAKSDLRGISLLDRDGHADSTLVVTHTATNCESRELYKHILDDTATGVFQGKVIVAPGAQKTDGKMMSRAIFLADGTNMYNKPELEIFADDVVCGHGATAGFLNEDQLFYLRARGIPEKEAQALLLEAFAAEAIENVGIDEIRALLSESVGQWLRQRQD